MFKANLFSSIPLGESLEERTISFFTILIMGLNSIQNLLNVNQSPLLGQRVTTSKLRFIRRMLNNMALRPSAL